MSYDTNDTTGLELFDFTASAVGTFPKAFRGYDRRIVDAYVYDLEHKAIQAKREARESGSRAFRLELLLDSGDFSKLGAHTASILTAAEQQSEELLAKAHSDSERILEEALSEAQSIRLAADEDAEETRMTGLNAIAGLKQNAETEAETLLNDAKGQADTLVAAAKSHAHQIQQQAEAAAQSVTSQANLDADSIRQSAKTEAAKIIADAEAERERLVKLTTEHSARVQEQINTLLADSTTTAVEYRRQVETQTANLARLRKTAERQAADIKAAAIAEADGIRATAKQQAAAIKDQADAYVFEQKKQLKRDIGQLTSRKEAISAQLANLSSLANLSMSELSKMNMDPATISAESELTTVLRPEENNGE